MPTPEQIHALIAEVHELYEERNKLAAVYYRLKKPDLIRVNQALAKLDDTDLEMVLGFAEGLASLR